MTSILLPPLMRGPEEEQVKPKRKRKAVTQDKFIVVRVTQDLYDKVQSASDTSGVNASKWVRRAVENALNETSV